MDQARWLVVFSVVVMMIVSLSLLHRFSQVEKVEVAPATPGKTAAASWQSQSQSSSRPVANSGKIRYSKPPAHVFSVENSAKFAEEQEQMKDKGKIIE